MLKRERRAMDWAWVRQQLLTARRALENAQVPDAERVAAVYRERAARLARRCAPEATCAAAPVLLVRVGDERYAIELSEVVEVMACAARAPVPGSRERAAAVVNVRGEIRPVWDLAALLGSSAAPAQAGSIVLVRRGDAVAGLGVDRLEQVRDVEAREWAAPAEGAAHGKALSADLLTLLDLPKLFEEEST
jgi:chemotaxis signal transduction protein